MAEGGGDENPYSFSKFVEKKSKRRNRQDDDPENEDERSNDASSGSEASHNDENTVDLLEGSTGRDIDKSERKKSSNDNPFSFKRFLQASASNPSRPAAMASSSSGVPSAGNGLLATLDLANDLPDFVQDHYHPHSQPCESSIHNPSISNRAENRLPPADVIQLPDFALDSTAAVANNDIGTCNDNNYRLPDVGLPPPDIETVSMGAGAHVERTPRLDNHRTPDLNLPPVYLDDSIHHEELPSVSMSASSGGLPDFLSDSALSNSLSVVSRVGRSNGEQGGGLGAVPKLHPMNGLRYSSDDDSDEDGDNSQSIRRLKEVNRDLRNQLREARELAQRESTRVSDTLRELDEQHRRDVEETAALETMIQNAERNLETTTQRAVTAESTVVRLKQEVTNLQVENESLRRQLGGGGSSLQSAALYASRQLDLTVKDAEYMLRQLLSGVDSLRVLSQILASADKITDLPPEGASGTDSNQPGGPTT